MKRLLALLTTVVGAAGASAQDAGSGVTAVPRARALLIGSNHYEKGNLGDLNCPEGDARELADCLAAQWQVTCHVPDGAGAVRTVAELETTLQRFLGAGTPEDTLLVYLSGHGVMDEGSRTEFFCLPQTDAQDLAGTGMSIRELQRRLGAGRRGPTILILDACRNRAPAQPERTPTNVAEAGFDRNAAPSTLFSTAPGVVSREPCLLDVDADGQPIERSLFTHFLLRGLRGAADQDRNGEITLRELLAYAGDRTAASSGRRQVPHAERGTAPDELALVTGSRHLAAVELAGRLPAACPSHIELRTRGGAVAAVMSRVDGAPLFVAGGRTSQEEQAQFRLYAMQVPDHLELVPRRTPMRGFYLDRAEVTNAQFAAFVQDGYGAVGNWPAGRTPDAARWQFWRDRLAGLDATTAQLPVTGVTWSEASAFASWAGRRLPTLLEWQYAVRGPAYRPVSWRLGNTRDDKGAQLTAVNVGWYFRTAPGSLRAAHDTADQTPEGVLNLCSNAREWTAEPFAEEPGWHWAAGASYQMRVSSFTSYGALPDEATRADLGFRCALDACAVLDALAGSLPAGVQSLTATTIAEVSR